MHSKVFTCKAILFDLDGTLIDSIASVDRAWSKWMLKNGLEPALNLPLIHGRRSIDSVRALTPYLNIEEEDAWLRNTETHDTEGVIALEGALQFLALLPTHSWSIVTSGTSEVAKARMKAAGIVAPQAVYGEDVLHGKPAPDPYLLAANRMAIDPSDCLVFEDTAAGVRSGHAAGMKVVAVTMGQVRPDILFADAVISTYKNALLECNESGLIVTI